MMMSVTEKGSISRKAHVKMMLHLSEHPTNAVHGILLGNYQPDSNAVEVMDVLPVCHNILTKPLIDMSLRAADALDTGMGIIGWYSANARVGDEDPSPVSFRVLENLKRIVDGGYACLIMLNNTKMENEIEPYDFYDVNSEKVSIALDIEDGGITAKATYKLEEHCYDFEDLLEDTSVDWLNKKAESKFCC